jgi:hypothetical protein
MSINGNGAMQGATAGASTGAMFGPWGAVIGAGVGAVAGATQGSGGGSGGGGGGGGMSGIGSSPLASMVDSMFGGGGSSSSLTDNGHMIVDVSGNTFEKGDINFSIKKLNVWDYVIYGSLAVAGIYIYKKMVK